MKRAFRQPVQQHGARKRRGGAVIIIAMIALLLASAIGAALVKMALAERRLVVREQLRLQSNWLAESGVQRAAARLAKNTNYSGETWNIPAAELGGRSDGNVVISVAKVASQPNRRRVTVVANFPAAGANRSRSRRVYVIGD